VFAHKEEFFFRFLVCERSTGIKPSNFGRNGSLSLLLLEAAGGWTLAEESKKTRIGNMRVSCGGTSRCVSNVGRILFNVLED